MTHPIAPPPELVQQWFHEAQRNGDPDVVCWMQSTAAKAAQWGSDQELRACLKWLDFMGFSDADIERLRDARHPKPPRLKEHALEHLEQIHANAYSMGMGFDPSIIRRALEQLDD